MAYVLIIGLALLFMCILVPLLERNQRRQESLWLHRLDDEEMRAIVERWERKYRVKDWS